MKPSAPNNELPALSERLRKERLARGWSIEDAADRVGASVSVIDQLESDVTTQLAGIYRDA